MARPRLTTALERGLVTLPEEGPILVFRPPAGYDLSALPRERLRIVTGFRPDADYWQAAGLETSREAVPAAFALVVVPRAKALARALVAEAGQAAGALAIDGQKTDGVDSLWREMRERVGDLDALTMGHGRIFAAPGGPAFADWAAPPPVADEDGFHRTVGVFSDDGPDRGSALLAEALPARLPPRVADLGAGWGYLSAAILRREGVAHLDLVEAEAAALDCARLNAADPRAAFHWADATRWAPEAPLDAVVTNPPFHVGRAADPGLGRAFIAAAAGMLAPQGHLWLVANRQLPYEAELAARFRSVEEIGGDRTYKLFHATRPRR